MSIEFLRYIGELFQLHFRLKNVTFEPWLYLLTWSQFELYNNSPIFNFAAFKLFPSAQVEIDLITAGALDPCSSTLTPEMK